MTGQSWTHKNIGQRILFGGANGVSFIGPSGRRIYRTVDDYTLTNDLRPGGSAGDVPPYDQTIPSGSWHNGDDISLRWGADPAKVYVDKPRLTYSVAYGGEVVHPVAWCMNNTHIIGLFQRRFVSLGVLIGELVLKTFVRPAGFVINFADAEYSHVLASDIGNPWDASNILGLSGFHPVTVLRRLSGFSENGRLLVSATDNALVAEVRVVEFAPDYSDFSTHVAHSIPVADPSLIPSGRAQSFVTPVAVWYDGGSFTVLVSRGYRGLFGTSETNQTSWLTDALLTWEGTRFNGSCAIDDVRTFTAVERRHRNYHLLDTSSDSYTVTVSPVYDETTGDVVSFGVAESATLSSSEFYRDLTDNDALVVTLPTSVGAPYSVCGHVFSGWVGGYYTNDLSGDEVSAFISATPADVTSDFGDYSRRVYFVWASDTWALYFLFEGPQTSAASADCTSGKLLLQTPSGLVVLWQSTSMFWAGYFQSEHTNHVGSAPVINVAYYGKLVCVAGVFNTTKPFGVSGNNEYNVKYLLLIDIDTHDYTFELGGIASVAANNGVSTVITRST